MQAENSSDKVLWTVQGPLVPVYLTEERLDHIRRHGDMIGNEDAIRDTVEVPNTIFESSRWSNRDVYFLLGAHSRFPQLYQKVVVEYDSNELGKVITAHLTDDLGQGTGSVKYVRRSQ